MTTRFLSVVKPRSSGARRCGYVEAGSEAVMGAAKVDIPALHRDFLESWF
jgi:hypothetical protein